MAATAAPSYSAYQVIVAWTLVLLLLWLIAQAKIGATLIYYTLVVMILFLVLTQYQAITSLLAPFTAPGGGNPNG